MKGVVKVLSSDLVIMKEWEKVGLLKGYIREVYGKLFSGVHHEKLIYSVNGS